MTKVVQNSWLGGQLDREMSGRQDMRQYRIGASVLRNFLPVKRGSIRKRPGTDFVADVTNWLDGRQFRMIPFGYKTGEGYVLVVAADATGSTARAYRVVSGTQGLSEEHFDVTGELPYEADELGQIGYVQCGDVVFLAHRNHPPAQIEHDIDTGGSHVFSYKVSKVNREITAPTITNAVLTRCAVAKKLRGGYQQEKYAVTAVVEIDGLEYESELSAAYSEPGEGDNNYEREKDNDETTTENKWIANGSTAYYLPWTTSQNIEIAVDGSDCVPDGSGWTLNKINLYKDSGGVWGLIASKSKSEWSDVADIRIIDSNILADTSVSPMAEKRVFDSPGNYPGCVGLYQQRLVWAGTDNDPARIWMSQAGDLYENRPHEILQVSDAIDFTLPITQFANIGFVVELGRLFAFSETSELVIGSASDSAGVSYETIMATEHSHLGCSKRLPPIVANNSLLFVSRTGDSVRDYDINISNSRYGGTDVSILSSGIFDRNPIVDWTWQQEPNSTVWCVLKDGRLASFTYVKEQEIAAWAVHELGGGGKARAVAKTCAVFGNDAEHPDTGEVLLVVERDGYFSLERMRPFGGPFGNGNADALCMDSMLPGDHGSTGRTYVQECGASGYPVESVMTTMHPLVGDGVGNAQHDVKLGQNAHLRVLDSCGGEIYAVGMDAHGATVAAWGDGEQDCEVVLAGSNSRDGRVTVRHGDPWPFQLLQLELDYETEVG